MSKLTYKDAGVDLDKYEESMARLPRLMQRTFSPRVIRRDGGFAGFFQLDFASPLFSRKYENPVLISCTDGVGTKLKVAMMANRHDTVGIDLVAMSVNDALCTGAEPLFFLDYVAMPKDDPPKLEQIVEGISAGCVQAGCALLGGETAIMPDLYADEDYDLAGFCVGVVEKDKMIDGSAIVPGDIVLGVGSSGLHSNGYSLARKVAFEHANLSVDDHVDALGTTIGEALLTPTIIYSTAVQRVLQHYQVKSVVHGIAHITGGGLHENLARIMPPTTSAVIKKDSWQMTPIFKWLRQTADIDEDEMFRVFNMGLGMVFVVSDFYASQIQRLIASEGYDCWEIGRVVEGDGSVGWGGTNN